VVSSLDRRLYRRTGGRLVTPGRPSGPIVLLTTTGRRTGKQHTTPVFHLQDGERASPYELRLRRPRIRSIATNAMPTVITAIHKAGVPMPATSMTAPMSINATAIQMKSVMAAPPFAPK
jgi:hypothetical protein